MMQKGKGKSSGKVGRRQQLIIAMLQQPSLEKAAASIGISKATAWRISKTAEFQEEFRRARREALAHARARLQHGSGMAASTLLKIMLDQCSPAASRVRAVHLVFELANKGIEAEDIEARIAQLERAADASQSDQHE